MQAINRDKNDLDAKWDKAVLHSEIDEPRKVSTCVSLYVLKSLSDPNVPQQGSIRSVTVFQMVSS